MNCSQEYLVLSVFMTHKVEPRAGGSRSRFRIPSPSSLEAEAGQLETASWAVGEAPGQRPRPEMANGSRNRMVNGETVAVI